MNRVAVNIFACLAALALGACSATDYTYLRTVPGNTPLNMDKRVHVVSQTGPLHHQYAQPLASIARDLVSLHYNYIIPEAMAVERHWAEGCADAIEAVLFIELLQFEAKESSAYVRMATELRRCHDGIILWRAEGGKSYPIADKNLTSMASIYATRYGEERARFAAPFFRLLKDLLKDLPNPELSDEEILEKIEFGQQATPKSDFVAHAVR